MTPPRQQPIERAGGLTDGELQECGPPAGRRPASAAEGRGPEARRRRTRTRPATSPRTEVEIDGADPAASDELTLAQTALAERTLDLQRLQAEYVNYKRRVERDRELVKQNATFAVLGGLLPVLDDIDRAREHGELEGGFKAVADSWSAPCTRWD